MAYLRPTASCATAVAESGCWCSRCHQPGAAQGLRDHQSRFDKAIKLLVGCSDCRNEQLAEWDLVTVPSSDIRLTGTVSTKWYERWLVALMGWQWLAIFLGIRAGMSSQALGSDHDAAGEPAQTPIPEQWSATQVLYPLLSDAAHSHSLRYQAAGLGRSGLWRQMKAGAQRPKLTAGATMRSALL